jgi:hypothetical protein
MAPCFVVALSVVVVASVAIVCTRRVVAVVLTALAFGLLAHQQGVALHVAPVETKALVGIVAMIAVVWNIWHTTAQKVGILRIYNAKSAAPVDKKVPLWVDRAFVFGWFPFLAARLSQQERTTILTQGRVVKMYLEPVLDAVAVVSPVLLPLGVLVIVATIGCFLYYEERANGLRNWPRLSMAAGLTLLSASFLFISPLKCYAAYGFSFAVEYVVFVWAFQRRRYAVPLSPPPRLQRILRHGAIFYRLFVGTYQRFTWCARLPNNSAGRLSRCCCLARARRRSSTCGPFGTHLRTCERLREQAIHTSTSMASCGRCARPCGRRCSRQRARGWARS